MYNDPYGCFLIGLVGIYAPNIGNQHIELKSSMYLRLSMRHVGLLMDDFNMCVDASQSTPRLN